LLAEKQLASSVLFLEEKIDDGPVLYRKVFSSREYDDDFDYVTDPAMRAAALVEFFKKVKLEGEQALVGEKPTGPATVYYIAHPVLKHLALNNYYAQFRHEKNISR
jgi:methionyl-tRNA formyltransferase